MAAMFENIKKGDKVLLHMFTGLATGVKTVIAVDKNTFTVETAKGDMKFSKKSGRQVDPKPKDDKFANYATEDDGSYKPPVRKPKKDEAPKKKKKAKPAPVEDDEEEEFDEDEYEDADSE